MVEQNKINTKLSNVQLSKLKSAVKNNEGTTLRMSNKNFNKLDLPHELFLTTRITKLKNKNGNNMSTDIKLSKAQIRKTVQSGEFLGRLLGRFLPKLIKPAISLGKNVLAPLGLSAAMSAADAGIQKNIFGLGTTSAGNKLDDTMNTVRISNSVLSSMMKIIKPYGITIFYQKE